MSAAYYLARLGYPVTVFEAMPVPGGMMAIGIPAYRLPRDVLQAEIARIVGLGVDLRLDTAMGRDFTLGDLEAEGYRAVFLATGASKSRRLGVPGDDAPGVVPATLFLKQVNLGEEPRLTGPAVVVGGGSTAMDAARSAWRSGASPVTIVYRRGRAEMPAQAEEIEAAEREGIVVRTGLAPVEVVGRDGAVVAMRCVETRATAGTTAMPAAPWEPVAGTERDLAGRDDPRRRRRGARSIDPARGRRDRGQRLGRHRRRPADAGDRPGRDLRRRRRRVRARRPSSTRSRPVDARPHRSTSTWRASPTARREILETVRYPTAPEGLLTLDLSSAAARPRAAADGRNRARSPPTQVGFDEATAQAEAARCFRCDAVYDGPDRRRPGRPRTGVTSRRATSACHTGSARHRWRRAMTPDQVSGFFDAGEGFIEGTIAAALVVLWLLALALHLGRSYMVRTTGKFTLRLGADLWWIIYVGLRDLILVQVFLGSFIFFYPDVVAGQALPITGGLAAVCAFAVLLIKLIRHGDETSGLPLAGPAPRARARRSTSSRTSSASR